MKLPASGDLHGRAVPEWVGRRPESQPPQAVLDRVFLRQRGRDPVTGRKIMPGDKTQVDHIIPLKDGGRNCESNLQILLTEIHRDKTIAENQSRAKERRMRMKHNGLWPKPKRKLQSRGFEKRGVQ